MTKSVFPTLWAKTNNRAPMVRITNFGHTVVAHVGIILLGKLVYWIFSFRVFVYVELGLGSSSRRRLVNICRKSQK